MFKNLIYLCSIILLLSCSNNDVSQHFEDSNDENDFENYIVSEAVDSLIEGQSRLGVNYNGQFEFIDLEDIGRTETIWVRGFIDFFKFYDSPALLESDEGLDKFNGLRDEGYKTILSIKWDFKSRNQELEGLTDKQMNDYKIFLEKILSKFWDKTDILVIGNEPYIETDKPNEGDKLVKFYREVTGFVEDYQIDKKPERPLPIFAGALNNLYLEEWQTESVNEFLNFVDNDLRIAGVDLHIHHGGIEQLRDFMDYADQRLGGDKRIVVTEFSIVKHFRSKMNEEISEDFAAGYGYDQEMKVYQYLDKALKEQVTKEEWDSFLGSSYWFENRKEYMQNAFNIFKEYPKFAVATTGIRQSFPPNKDFTADEMPWILNALFANRTVKSVEGQTAFNYAWIDNFRSVQESYE